MAESGKNTHSVSALQIMASKGFLNRTVGYQLAVKQNDAIKSVLHAGEVMVRNEQQLSLNVSLFR
jgi:hypothetical protein